MKTKLGPTLALQPPAPARPYAYPNQVMPDRTLERVYFRIPAVCPSLTKASRVELHNTIDRETPGKRILEFVEAFDWLYVDMAQQQWLQQFALWKMIKRRRQLCGRQVAVYQVGVAASHLRCSTFVLPLSTRAPPRCLSGGRLPHGGGGLRAADPAHADG